MCLFTRANGSRTTHTTSNSPSRKVHAARAADTGVCCCCSQDLIVAHVDDKFNPKRPGDEQGRLTKPGVWTVRSRRDTPHQTDGDSCGVFMLHSIICFILTQVQARLHSHAVASRRHTMRGEERVSKEPAMRTKFH